MTACNRSAIDPAAGVPTTEVVAKGDYLRFSKRDSLSLEAAFLQVCRCVYSSELRRNKRVVVAHFVFRWLRA